jgi:5'-3' exoribonuclease 2
MIEKDSPISDFYPENFQIDMNGKRNIWEGIVLLPFIEQEKLLNEVKKTKEKSKLSIEEENRNCFTRDLIFFSNS